MLKLAKNIECSLTAAVEASNKRICKNDEEKMMVTEDLNLLMKEFINYKISVDGGNGDMKSAQQSRQQILTILRALGTKNLSSLFERTDIREKFLFTYVKEQKYAPLTIQRYLLSLIHFYDFVICEDVIIEGVSPEEILRMKVIINIFLSFFTLFVQYGEARNVRTLNQKRLVQFCVKVV